MPQVISLEITTPAIPVYFLIGADRSWEHYRPDGLPEIIRQWFETHMPNVRIEPYNDTFEGYWDTGEGVINANILPSPLFLLDMTREQALQFPQRWQETMPTPEGDKNDIWFLTYDQACNPLYDPTQNPFTSTQQSHSLTGGVI